MSEKESVGKSGTEFNNTKLVLETLRSTKLSGLGSDGFSFLLSILYRVVIGPLQAMGVSAACVCLSLPLVGNMHTWEGYYMCLRWCE